MQEPENITAGAIPGLSGFLSSNKPFIIIWLALFVTIAGLGMVSPLLPVFAEDMGATGIWLGLVFSGFAFSQIPLTPVVGRLADRFGKKFFIWFGLLIYSLSAVGYLWSPSYHELVLFRIIGGVGTAMVIPVAFAYIGELAPLGHEGRYMGLFNVGMIAGFGIGPVLGGVIHDSLGTDATFVGMAALSMLGSIIVFLFLPATSRSGVASSPGMTQEKGPSTSLGSLLKDNTIQGIVTFQMVFGLLLGTMLAFVGIWMTTALDTSVAQVGIVLSARVITNGALSYPFGLLADRVNRITLASAGMVLVAVSTFSIPWLGSFTMLLGLFMVMGALESMAMPSVNAIAVEKGRQMGMGSVMAAFNMAMSLGLVTGSMAGGVVERSLGLPWVFRCAAILGVAGILVFNMLMRRSTHEELLEASQPAAADPQN